MPCWPWPPLAAAAAAAAAALAPAVPGVLRCRRVASGDVPATDAATETNSADARMKNVKKDKNVGHNTFALKFSESEGALTCEVQCEL
jgi:hypothetical protein